VGDLVQAAAVPMIRAMSRKRKMVWRDMGRLREEGFGSMGSGRTWCVLTRHVTNYYAM
jgi:hypothetical protein